MQHRHLANFLFIVVLTAVFFLLGYHEVFCQGPRGMHFIRQTDSLSFVSQYFNTNCGFFQPRLFNIDSIEGRAACEFPILYYLTAQLYDVLGVQVHLLKVWNLLISFTGLFCVMRLAYYYVQDYFYAFGIALFLCTSAVFNYYAFNYLPDPAALGFTFIGWYFYVKYQELCKKPSLVLAFAFFALAGLIKVTFLISPLAIAMYYLVARLAKKHQHLAETKWVWSLGLSTILLVAAWNAYVVYYNQLYGSSYFTTSAKAIWSLSAIEIATVAEYMMHHWSSKYFAQASFHLLMAVLLAILLFFKKLPFKLGMIMLWMFLGSGAYLLLFYAQFKDHDYYFLVFMPLVVFLCISGIKLLQNSWPNRWVQLVAKWGFGVVVVSGFIYAQHKTDHRHHAPMDRYDRIGYLIEEHRAAIDALNFPGNAKWIVAPDISVNGGLFFLNSLGWRIPSTDQVRQGLIRQYQASGADYLLLASNDEEALKAAKGVGTRLYSSEELYIFQLQTAADEENAAIGKDESMSFR